MIRELGDDEVALSFEAMAELRSSLTDVEQYVGRAVAQMGDGYRLVASFEDDRVVAVAGFRFSVNLAWGFHCYVDDLSTLSSSRGRGHAYRLLEWIRREAASHGAEAVHLDSGVQAERQRAHALYFRNGFRISSYHFSGPATVMGPEPVL
jgi:GNAT superfamily N-acetyltransferase